MSKVVISSLERWPPITFYDQGSKIGAYSTESSRRRGFFNTDRGCSTIVRRDIMMDLLLLLKISNEYTRMAFWKKKYDGELFC